MDFILYMQLNMRDYPTLHIGTYLSKETSLLLLFYISQLESSVMSVTPTLKRVCIFVYVELISTTTGLRLIQTPTSICSMF